MKSPRIAIVLLAAGSSSRMGKIIKQLLPWGSITLIEHMIGVAMASKAYELVVVLGANARQINDLISPASKCRIIENTEWEEGLSTSILHGVEYVRDTLPASDGVLIMLCDQPLLKSSYLDLMIDSFLNGDKNIVASNYGAKPGVPALFGKEYFPALCRKEITGGAQGLLAKNAADVIMLDPGLQVRDMDIPEEYELLLQLAKNQDTH